MEIKKKQVNVFIGPSGSKKIECLKKYVKTRKLNIFKERRYDVFIY